MEIEIEPIEFEKLLEKTKTLDTSVTTDNDDTRCWGRCDSTTPEEDYDNRHCFEPLPADNDATKCWACD